MLHYAMSCMLQHATLHLQTIVPNNYQLEYHIPSLTPLAPSSISELHVFFHVAKMWREMTTRLRLLPRGIDLAGDFDSIHHSGGKLGAPRRRKDRPPQTNHRRRRRRTTQKSADHDHDHGSRIDIEAGQCIGTQLNRCINQSLPSLSPCHPNTTPLSITMTSYPNSSLTTPTSTLS